MARSVPFADRSAVERNCASFHKLPKQRKGGRPWNPEPSCVGRDFVDSAERGSLAGHAREIPTSFDLLAPTAEIRRSKRGIIAEHLTNVSERVERAPAVEVERFVSGPKFCSCEKRACGSRKTKRAQGDEVDGGGRRPRVFLSRDSFHSASPQKIELAETTLATIR